MEEGETAESTSGRVRGKEVIEGGEKVREGERGVGGEEGAERESRNCDIVGEGNKREEGEDATGVEASLKGKTFSWNTTSLLWKIVFLAKSYNLYPLYPGV